MRRVLALILAILVTAATAGAGPQKKKKDKNDTGDNPIPIQLPVPDEVDRTISEMLAAWQIGDTNLLHRYYADDATWVSGAYEPAIQGWARFLTIYQQQRTHMEAVEMQRRNTFINFRGNIAWASYQWEFAAMYDGQQTSGRGQTTLVLEKRGDAWVILHNHTSQICEAPPAPQPQQAQPPQQPAKPPGI